jgi:hypothetical protein
MESDLSRERLKDYSVDWNCRDCSSQEHKIDELIAWRPASRDAFSRNIRFLDVGEDDREYLVKWANCSHFHCVWKPGAWVYGIAASALRVSFRKRASASSSFLKADFKDAIPEEYLLPDIIFSLKYKDGTRPKSKEDDLDQIDQVTKILVKFQGLGYDKAVWDRPPSRTDGTAIYQAFKSAYAEYLNGKYFRGDAYSKMKERISEFKEEDFGEAVLKSQPAGVVGGTLMDYQLLGVNWMLRCYHRDQNAILADEMGLGKTIQVIALITSLVLDSPRVPTSLPRLSS